LTKGLIIAILGIDTYMDNRTLLIALDIVLLSCALFSLVIGRRGGDRGWAWRAASLSNFGGFLLISFQPNLPAWASVVAANALIVAGTYAQVAAAARLGGYAEAKHRVAIPILLALFLGSFLYFTYVRFDTAARVVVVSSFLAAINGGGAVILLSGPPRPRAGHRPPGIELAALFLCTALFFASRIVVTVVDDRSMVSLLDRDTYTSASFVFTLLQNLVFFMGMATATLRAKNDQLRIEKERFQYLFSFLRDTAGHLDLDALYLRIGDILTKTLSIDSGAIYLLDEGGESISLVHPINYLDIDTSSVLRLRRGEGIIWQAIERDEVVEVDLRDYPDSPIRDQMVSKGVRYLAVAPIRSADGVIGGISALFTAGRGRAEADKDLFYYLGEQIGLVLHNALKYGEVSAMAHTDALTGLYTRRRFSEILSAEERRSGRSSSPFCLAMADLDFFKRVNDTAGHECGDRLLRMAADLFVRECRDSDSVCRWGGEEFMFLFVDTELGSATLVAERVRAAFERSACGCAGDEPRTISVGLTQSEAGVPVDELVRKVDDLLYEAKRSGRNRVVARAFRD